MSDYEVTGCEEIAGEVRIRLELETRKWHCCSCKRFFWQRFPGIQPRFRASESFRRSVCQKHFDGISRSRLAKRERLSGATIELWFGWFLRLLAGERIQRLCPRMLSIDEHFFTGRHGYATTFCDWKNHQVHDVVLGRSEASLESYLTGLEGKEQVEMVCMDLVPGYRALVRQHFPQARIVADRFHVVRAVNHHFLACGKEIDPGGAKNRGLVSLLRRHRHNLSIDQGERLKAYLAQHPALESIYRSKQHLMHLLLGERPEPQPLLEVGAAVSGRCGCAAWLRARATGDLGRDALFVGETRLRACGVSPATMRSPKVFTPRFKFCSVRLMDSATSRTTGCGLRECVLENQSEVGSPPLSS